MLGFFIDVEKYFLIKNIETEYLNYTDHEFEIERLDFKIRTSLGIDWII